MRFHETNVVSWEMVSDGHHTPIIRKYLHPYNIDHLEYLEGGLNRLPGRESIIIGDLNSEIGLFQNLRIQQVADCLDPFSLVDLIINFRKRLHFYHMKMWW